MNIYLRNRLINTDNGGIRCPFGYWGIIIHPDDKNKFTCGDHRDMIKNINEISIIKYRIPSPGIPCYSYMITNINFVLKIGTLI